MVGRMPLLAVGLLLLAASTARGQTWMRTYGTSGNDHGYGFAVASAGSGEFFLVGSTGGYLAHDLWIQRVDSAGAVLWERTYDLGRDENVRGLARVDAGLVMVATLDLPPGGEASWVLKVDDEGGVVWSRVLEDPTSFDRVAAIVERPGGGYVLAGYTSAAGGGKPWFAGIDDDGHVLWEQALQGPGTVGSIQALAVTEDGGFVATGSHNSELSVLRFGPEGETDCSACWQRVYVSPGYSNTGESIVPLDDGGFVVAGRAQGFGGGKFDVWVLRLDPAGDVVWARVYGNEWNDEVFRVVATADGGFALTGIHGTAEFRDDGWLFKLGPSGTVLWQYLLGNVGGGGEYFYDLLEDEAGYLLAAGFAWLGAGMYDVIGARTAPDGSIDPGCGLATPISPATWPATPIVEEVDLVGVSIVRTHTSPWPTIGSVDPLVMPLCEGEIAPPEPSAGGEQLRILGDGLVVEHLPAATAYNVYVDELGSWYHPSGATGTVCTVTEWTDNGNGTIELGVEVPEQSWVLISASNEFGESAVGVDSRGTDRFSVGVWPDCPLGP